MMTPRPMPVLRGGFSLVELLTVIAIIALIIGLAVPALSGARDAGRRAATQALLNDVTNAAAAFRRDNGDRLPGYFSPAEMGRASNRNAGLSAMENAMLDLAGGAAVRSRANIPAGETAAYVPAYFDNVVGPNQDDAAWVNPGLIGSGEGNYFTPPGEFYVAQTNDGQVKQVGNAGHTAAEGQPQLPDLVDSFGSPILLWVADTTSVISVNERQDFGALSSSGARPALFYWNSNAAFLRSPSFGRKSVDMTAAPEALSPTSLIGEGAMGLVGTDQANVADHLGAFLGSPSYPNEGALSGASPYTAAFPTRGRGDFIVHSAGRDGVPFAADDKGFKSLGGAGVLGTGTINIRYGINFALPNNTRRNVDGVNTTVDFAGGFDDLLSASN